MRVAIVGGGAAGLMTAWMLRGVHELTLFEKAPFLGGNIRTLGRNVACDGLPDGQILDAGVIEFSRTSFPLFHGLMAALDVELFDVPGTTQLIVDGRALLESPGNIVRRSPGFLERCAAMARLLPLGLQRARFFRGLASLSEADLYERSSGDLLRPGAFGHWARLLMTYAYSIPFEQIDDTPAALTGPTLRQFMQPNDWTAVRGGVYRYVERILAQTELTLRTDCAPRGIERRASQITLTLPTGETEHFDHLVLAVPPAAVLGLLDDADEDERRRFGPWRMNRAHTLIHHDAGLYERRGLGYASEFDVISTAGGENGYNACLNRLCEVPESSDRTWGLAYGIDSEIDPSKVIHTAHHETPLYTVEALRSRPEIIATNGRRNTSFAGAWLYNGLHEGAVRSAMEVSRLLGGGSPGQSEVDSDQNAP